MNTKSIPLRSREGPAAKSLIDAVESAIGGLQERLANIASERPDAKWSVSDLVRLLQLRGQLQEERPRTITARWVDNDSPRPIYHGN
jgi:hypothetical protein